MKEAKRIQSLPPYLFAQIEEKISKATQEGVDVISLGIGDPDLPTPQRIIDTLTKKVQLPENHRYPTSAGLIEFRQAIADWYQKRFEVQLDPNTEVTSLIGSKEGIANISFCFLDPGDVSLVPDPGYPVYAAGALFAGGEVYKMPLLEENQFLPNLGKIPSEILKKAKLLWLNYPNNPTGAIVSQDFLSQAVEFAKEHDILLCHDAAYTEIAYDDYQPHSLLSIPGAKNIGIEFHSVSKTYNMTGWRIGWAAGNADAVGALRRFKTNIDSGIFTPIQYSAISALAKPISKNLISTYQERRDLVIESLNSLGWNLAYPKATIYIWAPVPNGFTSIEFAEHVFEKTGVVVTPGIGYGEYGEGYFRVSLCLTKQRIMEAFKRWKEANILFK